MKLLNGTGMRSKKVSLRRTQRGATMIEVLVTVVIVSVGLLGIASVQLIALRNSQGALQSSMATMYTYSMLDSLRANAEVARSGGYDGEYCSVPTGDTLAATDLHSWMASMRGSGNQVGQLGSDACGGVDCDSAGACTITVSWRAAEGSGEMLSVETESTL